MSSSPLGHVSIKHAGAGKAVSRAGRGALLAYTFAIIYASLNPFFGWRAPETVGLFSWPRYFSVFDIVLNVLAYIPLGGMLAGMQLRGPRRRDRSLNLSHVLLRAVLAGFALSALMEGLQTLLPMRVSSPADLIANTAGAFIGAGALVSRRGRAMLARGLRWRHRYFARGDAAGWGLLLLGAWLFAQLNPVIPFFEAGHIAAKVEAMIAPAPYDPLVLLPQAVGITLNVCGFALFLSLLLHPGRRTFMNVLLILALGFFAKISSASLMLKTPQMVGWLGPATIIGLSAGLLLFAYFSRIRYRWRAFCTTLFIFAGGLMAKMASVYGAFDETLRLFNWPYGHLISFASLTRWVHETWPLLACILVAWIFVKHRESH
ncbi:MAG: VanZ family protein [Betaproteobacteria bacterium]